MQAIRPALSFLLFFALVVVFTFVSTTIHEVSHAAAWGDVAEIQFHDDRAHAEEAITHEESRRIDGRTYRVQAVEETTIALYPKAILAAGATLGLAPANLLPDSVLGSTFYALDDDGYAALAHGESATSWYHSAMPMIVNAIIGIPVFIWLVKRPGIVSMAAAWVSAGEWRFNVHHAEEVGIPVAAYLGFSVLLLTAVAGWIGLVATGRKEHAPSVPVVEAIA